MRLTFSTMKIYEFEIFCWSSKCEKLLGFLLPYFIVLYLLPLLTICPIMLVAFIATRNFALNNVADFLFSFLLILPYSFVGPSLVLKSHFFEKNSRFHQYYGVILTLCLNIIVFFVLFTRDTFNIVVSVLNAFAFL